MTIFGITWMVGVASLLGYRYKYPRWEPPEWMRWTLLIATFILVLVVLAKVQLTVQVG